MTRLLLLCLTLTALLTADVLNDFKPSTRKSEFGVVSRVDFATGMMEVEPGSLAIHLPQAMIHFHFAEPVWIVGYKTTILDAKGKTPKENHLCHTFIGDQRVMQTEDQEVRGLYTDGYTPEVILPDGFGIQIPAEEPLHWMPMFNNRAEMITRVKMKVELSVIRQKDLRKPMQQLFATLRSVEVPHLYFVQPGKDERGANFELPFDAKIHFMGTHIHPYGVFVQLDNVTRKERVWRGNKIGGSENMEVFSNGSGYAVKKGETLRVSAAYENPTQAPIDAMAGLYILYSRAQ
jgi:hypothetical protein